MKYLIIATMSFCVLLNSCNVTKGKETQSDKEQQVAEQIDPKKMIEQGFEKGLITISKSEGCPYILNIEKYKDNLDPINLKDFFKDEIPEKVWVKFSNMRMQSRCEVARPITITEISERTEE